MEDQEHAQHSKAAGLMTARNDAAGPYVSLLSAPGVQQRLELLEDSCLRKLICLVGLALLTVLQLQQAGAAGLRKVRMR